MSALWRARRRSPTREMATTTRCRCQRGQYWSFARAYADIAARWAIKGLLYRMMRVRHVPQTRAAPHADAGVSGGVPACPVRVWSAETYKLAPGDFVMAFGPLRQPKIHVCTFNYLVGVAHFLQGAA